MYLVDTSVWIDFFRQIDNIPTRVLHHILERRISFGITSIIYQEILQGANSIHDYKKLVKYFKTQQFYQPKDEILSYQHAAEIYFNCARKGVTIRSTVDCLIAQIALEHRLILLHHDKDFERINSVVDKLTLFQDAMETMSRI
jgi:predicted nucleic acid-binding protein